MITKHLLQARTKIETTDKVGRTALHRAAAKRHDEIVKIPLTKLWISMQGMIGAKRL